MIYLIDHSVILFDPFDKITTKVLCNKIPYKIPSNVIHCCDNLVFNYHLGFAYINLISGQMTEHDKPQIKSV